MHLFQSRRGMQTPEFNQVVADIYTFQYTGGARAKADVADDDHRADMPGVLKNVFRILDSKSAACAFDANLLVCQG